MNPIDGKIGVRIVCVFVFSIPNFVLCYTNRTVCAVCIKTYSYCLLCNNTNSEKRRKFAKVENFLFFFFFALAGPASVFRFGVLDSLAASTIHIHTSISSSSSFLSFSSPSLFYKLSTKYKPIILACRFVGV